MNARFVDVPRDAPIPFPFDGKLLYHPAFQKGHPFFERLNGKQ
jgi:hypothetical protein